MDNLETYRGTPASPIAHRHPPTAQAVDLAAVKNVGNYLRALRRRFWVVLAIAVPLAIGSSIFVLRMPLIYVVKAEIEIVPPEVEPALSTLVSTEIGKRDAASQASFVPNHEIRLRSKGLAEDVVHDPAFAAELAQYVDPAFELFKSLSVVQPKKGSNAFVVSLEGQDPSRTKRLLETLLVKFQSETEKETLEKLNGAGVFAEISLTTLKNDTGKLDAIIEEELKKSRTVGPGGKSIIEEEYVSLGSLLTQKQMQLGSLQQQSIAAQMMPKVEFDGAKASRADKMAMLEEKAQEYAFMLKDMKGRIRNFNNDRSVKVLAGKLDHVLDQIESMRPIKTEMAASPIEMCMEQIRREIEVDREQHDQLLAQLHESLPEHQRVMSLLADRADKAKQIADLEDRLRGFAIVKKAMISSKPVRIPLSLVEPTVPIRPNRPLLIALGLFASFGLGIMLVCFLEHIDHSVKVPEHVTHGLTLPLLGVVPRIRRTSLTYRGGHLWTSATPDSIEADAYRNVRASLLGVADKVGEIVTLLVTSAKAGEGKSTTAINLAATCARAGERTVLLDVDLRRPSLAGVFIDDEEADGVIPGLIDVLRGELPWQRVVRHSEISNLDFIPTGDTSTIPIEILGTRELRQLLIALSNHYDRVILDGPAVLGLADCRVLGRIVDASLLVVRSGSNQLMTLHRAKAMLEQSHVAIAGVVFNGLADDIDEWSSYGYEPTAMVRGGLEALTSEGAPRSLAGAH